MATIEFDAGLKQQLVLNVKAYFERELDYEIGGFDAEFLIDFFSKELGGHYYNQGILDAQAAIEIKLGEIQECLFLLEKETT